jgi:hypothetical protein
MGSKTPVNGHGDHSMKGNHARPNRKGRNDSVRWHSTTNRRMGKSGVLPCLRNCFDLAVEIWMARAIPMIETSTLPRPETAKGESSSVREFPYPLPPREFLQGEALDRFLARCYLTIERWATEIRLEQQAKQEIKKGNPPQ